MIEKCSLNSIRKLSEGRLSCGQNCEALEVSLLREYSKNYCTAQRVVFAGQWYQKDCTLLVIWLQRFLSGVSKRQYWQHLKWIRPSAVRILVPRNRRFFFLSSFESGNGIQREEKGFLKNPASKNPAQVMSGSWSYTGPDGKVSEH